MTRIRLAFALPIVAAALLAPQTAAAKSLPAPVLDAPADNAHVESAPALAWKAVKGAARYEYQLASDSAFGSVILGSGSGLGSNSTRNTAAALSKTVPDGPYFWRVRAVDASDTAGRWSRARSYTQAWTTAPILQGPANTTAIAWPSTPLILKWSAVPYATSYIVTIATDPALTSPVLGTATDPQKTSGTAFAFPNTLAPGPYYWAITPLDESGHKGQRSAVGSFTWSWLTTATTSVVDANAAPSVYDPLFSWTPVPGAATYDVEVNPSHDWAPGSRICCTDRTIGTSLSPVLALQNNAYYWRVRAVDASGNAGIWNEGPSFQKDFDPTTPSIPNLRVRDRLNDPAPVTPDPPKLPDLPITSTPILAWDPVPGASSYVVETVGLTAGPLGSHFCDWSGAVIADQTPTNVLTYMSGAGAQGPLAYQLAGFPTTGDAGLADGTRYCVRVRARSDRPGSSDSGYVSDWTQINGLGEPAFQFKTPDPVPGTAPVPFATPAANYLAPVTGTISPRAPLFTWDPVPGARGYYVVVSRDATFTTIADYAFTKFPEYAPGSGGGQRTFSDETSHYYWVVIPAANADGTGASTVPAQNNPQSFDKRSEPPALLGPVLGEVVVTQPTFRWTSSEGARKYRLQISQDPTFGDPIDDVTTASTAYTSSTTYPADTTLYWRVGGLDENQIRLNWSVTGTFRRQLPTSAPAPDNPGGGDGILPLAWLPVPGAISYDFHVDKIDGATLDFTTSSPALTPTEFYGSGIWHWKVRPNFPTSTGRSVSGGYFASQQYVHSIGHTPHVRASASASRILISWDPDPVAKSYRVEVSRSSGFGDQVDRFDTSTTNYAPDLDRPPYADGGALYWRVATVEGGNNIGPFTTGRFTLPKAISVNFSGVAQRGVVRDVTVTLTDARGRPVRGARVRVTGRGLRSAARRSSRAGAVTFRLRPSRKGVLTFTVTRRGYRDAVATAQVF